ncbi:MAG TPA: EamA family transporter [Candidatus Thermoplasmatota archaeon]
MDALRAQSTPRPDATTLSAFGGFVLIGGSNFVAVRFSNAELPPFWGASTRFAVACLLFLVVVMGRRIGLPRGKALVGATLFGILNFGLFYAFVYYALVYVQAGLAAVILGLTPLATFFLAVLQRLEAFQWRGVAGAALAVCGVGVVFWEQLDAAVPPLALIALLGGALCAAQAGIVVKRFPPVNPWAMNAVGMAVGAAIIYILSELTGEVHVIPVLRETWIAFAYLTTIGAVVLFLLVLFVLRRWTASATSYAFVLFPVVATAMGAGLSGETVTVVFVLGSALVLAGVYFGALVRPAPKPVSVAGAEATAPEVKPPGV